MKILVDGEPAPRLVSRKAEALLVYLAVTGQSQRREAMAELLWPERTQSRAMSNLRTVLSSLRKVLGGYVQIERRSIGLKDRADIQVDLLNLERKLELGQLEAAVAIYRGRFLEGLHLRDCPGFESWQSDRAARVERKIAGALEDLVQSAIVEGDYVGGQSWAHQLIELDALNESAHRSLILLLALDGRRSAALEAFDRLESLLIRELEVVPMLETAALHAVVLAGESLTDFVKEAGAGRVLRSPGLSARLVGRKRETEELASLWRSASVNTGGFALVSGAAGIGKTNLVSDFASRIASQNGRVLQGFCFEFEQAMPLRPVVEMLRSAADGTVLEQLAPVHQAALAQVAPELVSSALMDLSRFSESGQFRLQLFEALLQVFLLVSQQQPLMMILEDVHWATTSTLDWLAYITPRLGSSRILIVATYRLYEVGSEHALARLERRFRREGMVTVLALDPLSLEATSQLIAGVSGLTGEKLDSIVDRLFRESGGNPFLLHEIVKGFIEVDVLEETAAGWQGPFLESIAEIDIPLSASLLEAIRARVMRLNEKARVFLRIASVAGRLFEFSIVRHAGGWDEEHALSALEDCLARGFVRAGDHAGSYAFSHHLLQESIYADITAARRAYLHAALARAIRQLNPEDVEGLVHHYIAADEAPEAVEYAIQAAKRADRVYAYEEAIEFRKIALVELTGMEDKHRRSEVLEGIGDAYRLLRQGDDAVRFYDSSLDLINALPKVDPQNAARLIRKILQTTSGMWGRSEFRQFEAAQTISSRVRDQAERILSVLETDEAVAEIVLLRRSMASDAQTRQFPPDWGEALIHAEAAVQTAEELGEPAVLSAALATLGVVYAAQGRMRERVILAERRSALTNQPDFHDPPEHVRSLIGMGSALVHVGEYLAAVPYLRQAERLAGQIRAVDLQSRSLSLLQQVWFRLDQWDEMDQIDAYREALLETHTLGRIGAPCFAIGLSAAVQTLRGDFHNGKVLRSRSNEIMLSVNGPPEVWTRSPHY